VYIYLYIYNYFEER